MTAETGGTCDYCRRAGRPYNGPTDDVTVMGRFVVKLCPSCKDALIRGVDLVDTGVSFLKKLRGAIEEHRKA